MAGCGDPRSVTTGRRLANTGATATSAAAAPITARGAVVITERSAAASTAQQSATRNSRARTPRVQCAAPTAASVIAISPHDGLIIWQPAGAQTSPPAAVTSIAVAAKIRRPAFIGCNARDDRFMTNGCALATPFDTKCTTRTKDSRPSIPDPKESGQSPISDCQGLFLKATPPATSDNLWSRCLEGGRFDAGTAVDLDPPSSSSTPDRGSLPA